MTQEKSVKHGLIDAIQERVKQIEVVDEPVIQLGEDVQRSDDHGETARRLKRASERRDLRPTTRQQNRRRLLGR